MMVFLNTKDKANLQKILIRSSQLQTAHDRNVFLSLCGLEKYCASVQLDQSPDKFVAALIVQLSKVYIPDGNSSKKLGLVVFLENISEMDSSLNEDDNAFIQKVIHQWEMTQQEQPRKKSAVQNPQHLPKSTPYPSPISPPPKKKPISVNPLINSPKTIGQQKNIAPSYNLTASSAVRLGNKIWFILLPIVIIWFLVGVSYSFIPDIKITDRPTILVISGSVGGLFSGLGGWLAWWRIAPRSVQLEQALLSSVIGLIGGAIGWSLVGIIFIESNNLIDDGGVVGLFFGLIVVGVIFWGLNIIRSRA